MGKDAQDLGDYDICDKSPELNYVLVNVQSESNSLHFVNFGLCVPTFCKKEDLEMMDKIYM
jgi:hypothetical protein